MATIAFDIEVVGHSKWEDVDEATQDYLEDKEMRFNSGHHPSTRMALHLGLGKVVAIGLWAVEHDRGMCLLEGEGGEQAWDAVPGAKVFRGTEEELMHRFWKTVSGAEGKKPKLVTFNGRGYDGPVMMIRSAQLGIPVERNLLPKRWELWDHTDLCDALCFLGAVRDKYRLDYWCKRFGVPSPKEGIDGSQVGAAYAEGRIEEIGAYCLRDAKATAELYSVLEDNLLGVMR